MIETQISAEGATYSRDDLNSLIDLAEKGASELFNIQHACRT
jgi:ribonuclease PH